METRNLLITKKREPDQKEIYILNEDSEHYESLKELVLDLHYETMPNDLVFEIVGHYLEHAEDYESREDFEECPNMECISVYIGELRNYFKDLDHVLESAWNDLSDYVHIDSGYSPFEYQEKCIWGYCQLVKYRVAEWCEEHGVWGESE